MTSQEQIRVIASGSEFTMGLDDSELNNSWKIMASYGAIVGINYLKSFWKNLVRRTQSS